MTWSAQQATGRALTPSQVSAYWRDRALTYAWENPGREAALSARKILAFVSNADRFDNYDRVFIRENFPSLLTFLPSFFGLILVLAVAASTARTGGDERRFLVACVCIYGASVLLFYVTDRYRLPVVVFLLPLAGTAWPVLRKWREIEPRRRTLAAAAALIVAGLSLWPPLGAVDQRAYNWGVVTMAAADRGDGDLALRAFERAVALSPTQAGVQAYVRAALVYETRGQGAAAEALLDRAVGLFPQDGVALYNKGRMQAARGDIAGAVATMNRARALTPTYGLIYYALVKLYEKQGNAEAAAEALRAGGAINPNDARLLALVSP